MVWENKTMHKFLTSLGKAFTQLIFPYFCSNCHKRGYLLCSNCALLLKPLAQHRCIVCQTPSWQGYTHPKCATKLTPQRLISIFDYNQPLISSMINLGKYSCNSQPFYLLSELATEFILPSCGLQNSALCPIPLSKFKQNFRGFNQSLVIAKVFSKKLNIPVIESLQKRVFVKQQKHLTKSQRSNNIKRAFMVLSEIDLNQYSKIILVDDVTSSGATLLEATKALKLAGARQVWCLCVSQN